MSYPVLEAARGFARVEVREGRGAAGWGQMVAIFDGPCDGGQQWKGGEGDKLAARHCLWPDDPASSMSQPYTVAGTGGLQAGRRELLRFPSGI